MRGHTHRSSYWLGVEPRRSFSLSAGGVMVAVDLKGCNEMA